MKISKSQALYRALPGSWTTYSKSIKSDYKYACKVTAWNTKKVDGIDENMIKKDILRRVNSFRAAGGETGEEFSENAINNMKFVEPAMNEQIPDIVCEINPTTFYCPKCDKVKYMSKANSSPVCYNKNTNIRHGSMNQLQMVYACECGYADGVKPMGSINDTIYYHSKDNEHKYAFYNEKGRKYEMVIKCPVCGNILRPKNATDSRIFYSQSGSLVDLFNKKYVEIIKEYKNDAEILMLAKWFNIINNEQFLSILNNPKDFFENKGRDSNDPEIVSIAKALGKTPEEIIQILNSQQEEKLNISTIKSKIEHILPFNLIKDNLDNIVSNLIEFDTLKYPKAIIPLDTAIRKGMEIGNIVYEEDISELVNKLHIKNIQVSEAVRIVNYAYGYTRINNCPSSSENGRILKLRGFKDGSVFTNILETEGILVELDYMYIYQWLIKNNIIEDLEYINNETDAKKWFIENINLSMITHFSEIDCQYSVVTKVVYSLLHTISHMMIISAGRNSGLSKDSISEIIFPNVCSFFIYPTSCEGVTLGSISGMFETKLYTFLQDALKNNEICTFDPICSTTQNGACIACTYLNEVNCTHFNKDLSRLYLYGGTVKLDKKQIKIKKGFWK